MSIEILKVGQLMTNCYLFYNKSKAAFIIDPGDDGEYIINKIQDLQLIPKAIIFTHGHFDHVLAAMELKLAFNIPIYANSADYPIIERAQSTAKYYTGIAPDPPAKPNENLVDEQILNIDGLELKVIQTPGHTPGSISLFSKKNNLVFTGDTLFSQGSYGRTDLKGGSLDELKKSIRKLMKLPGKTVIYPGHDDASTIEKEKKYYINRRWI